MRHIGLVVEGPGDREAVPVLVRKYLAHTQRYAVNVGHPISANGRDTLLKEGKLEAFVGVAAAAPEACGVLVVFDAEADDVCPLGPDALTRADSATGLPVRVAVAVRQFENWIAAVPEAVFGDESGLEPLDDPEGQGAVAIIKQGLRPRAYNKPVYQPKLTSRMDLESAAHRCPSLRRLFRCVDELLDHCEEAE